MAGHTEGAQVVQLAHAAARVDWDDVVSMPRIALQHLFYQSVLRIMHFMLIETLRCTWPAASVLKRYVTEIH